MLTFLLCVAWGCVGLSYGLLLVDAKGRRGFVSLPGVIACLVVTIATIAVTWDALV